MATLSPTTTKSPFTVYILVARKQGTTHAEFREYYENTHAPLGMRTVLTGQYAPTRYTRYYIDRDTRDAAPGTTQFLFPFGAAESWEHDVITQIEFRDRETYLSSLGSYAEHGEAIVADEEKFMDRSRTRVVVVGEGVSNVRS